LNKLQNAIHEMNRGSSQKSKQWEKWSVKKQT